MTVAALMPSINYLEDGVSLDFPVPFRFLPGTLVITRLLASGVAVPLSEGPDFSVVGGATDSGGTATLVSSIAGARLRIRRDTTRTQQTDYDPNDTFPAESHEAGLDRAMLIDQEQDVAQSDLDARAIKLPIGEAAGELPPAAERIGRIFTFGSDGLPYLLAGSPAQLAADLSAILARIDTLEIDTAAAVSADWAALPNLKRKIDAAQFQSGTVITFVGMGNSNMNGAGVGGFQGGDGNTPVEVAMRTAQAILDPQGFCSWECHEVAVDGASISTYGAQKAAAEAFSPDVIVDYWITNDSSPENFNSGQGLNGYELFVADTIMWANGIGADIIKMTGAHAKVSAIEAVNIYGRSGLMLHPGIGMVFPRNSFSLGRTDVPADEIDFTFTAATKRITSSVAGAFINAGFGFGIAVGKKIEVRLPDGLPDPTNGGVYSIAAVDPAGNYITLANEFSLDGNLVWTDLGPATLTDGTYAAFVQRIDIDATTELAPTVAQGAFDYEYAASGATVRVLSRYLIVNQKTREAVAQTEGSALLFDLEAYYFPLVDLYGEDRYYSVNETVHFNSQLVIDAIEPGFVALWRSLGAVKRAVTGDNRLFMRRAVVRPDIGLNPTIAQIAASGAVDLQVGVGEEAVLARNSGGKKALYYTAEDELPKLYKRIFGGGGTVAFNRYEQPFVFIESTAQNVPIPDGHFFTAWVFARRGDIGARIVHVAGICTGGVVTLTPEVKFDGDSVDAVVVTAAGGNMVLTPQAGAATTMFVAVHEFMPFGFVAA